jgi:hypothetical protein
VAIIQGQTGEALSHHSAIPTSNNLTCWANHRHIFIVARIKPAPETRCGLFESGRLAKAANEPNRKRHFRAIARPNLQALAFKHLKPSQSFPRGRGHIIGPPEGVPLNL